jgi:hypothetical protein
LTTIRPAELCRELIATIEASEGRRRRRKRNTTPDAIGLAMKRELLDDAVAANPAPDEFEEWLFQKLVSAGDGNGGLRAIALSVLEEWRLASEAEEFRHWLANGAPSDDAMQHDVKP